MKQTKVPRDLSTSENRAFWNSVDNAAAEWNARNEGREIDGEPKPEIKLSKDYVIQYDPRATGCPNHPDTDRQDIWFLCPTDAERWEFIPELKGKNSLPAFYVCFICRRVFRLGDGEIPNETHSKEYERGAEAR